MVVARRIAQRDGALSRWNRTWATALAVSAATLAACASEEGHPALPIDLSASDSGSTTHAELGQRIDVTLQTIGPGSYEGPSSSTPVLRFLGQNNPHPQTPAGPTQVYGFLAEAGGTVTVEIPHSVRPDPFVMTVVVQ